MSTTEILDNEKNRLKSIILGGYANAKTAEYTYDASDSKTVTLGGGSDRLGTLETALASLNDVGDIEGMIEQSDGTFVMCSVAEWDTVIKAIRAKGRALYIKKCELIGQIDALTVDSTFDDVYSIVWVN